MEFEIEIFMLIGFYYVDVSFTRVFKEFLVTTSITQGFYKIHVTKWKRNKIQVKNFNQ